MKVLVLMGGVSLERDVSLATGREVADALKSVGHEVKAVDTAAGIELPDDLKPQRENLIGRRPPDTKLIAQLDKKQMLTILDLPELNWADVVFLAFHGGSGENGEVQALLDMAGVKYTGSGLLSSALSMNKALSKRLFSVSGIKTPGYLLIRKGDFSENISLQILERFSPPVIVKPNDQGSTVGLTLVEDEALYDQAIEAVYAVSEEMLVEEYIPGRELTVAVLDDSPLPVVEILPKGKLYDYECKYTSGMCEYACPADLPESLAQTLQGLGKQAFDLCQCRGYARVDFRLDLKGRPFCLEVNTLPGMTTTSLVPKAAKASGLSFAELLDKIVKLAL